VGLNKKSHRGRFCSILATSFRAVERADATIYIFFNRPQTLTSKGFPVDVRLPSLPAESCWYGRC
jgi:hypothetical protein